MNNIQSIVATRHEFEGVDFIEYNGEFFKGCKRCGGTGHFSFDGESSDCYACGNTSAKLGDHLGTIEQAQKWAHGIALGRARAAAKREAERLKLVAKMEAKQEAVKAADAEVFEFIMSIELQDALHAFETEEEFYAAQAAGTLPKRERSAFLVSLAENLRYVSNCDKAFSDKMIAAARKVMESRKVEEAEKAAHPAPSGAVVVTGEITSYKVVEGDYGTAYKVNVKSDEGFRVWVSLAKSLVDSAYNTWLADLEAKGLNSFDAGPEAFLVPIVGRRLTFTATLEPSRDDASFAFGSRPRKATWI